MPVSKKNIYRPLAIVPVIMIVGLLAWLLLVIFEGEKPLVALEPMPEYLAKEQTFTIKLRDSKRGLKRLRVSYNQGGRDVILLEKEFPFDGLLNRQGVHQFEQTVTMDPVSLRLAQGRVDLNVQAWDYSRRGGGDGNMSLVYHKMTVDTLPPSIRTVTRMHNINIGGTGLVVYRTSSDTVKSGVYVEDLFFPGFPLDNENRKGLYVTYIAVPYHSSLDPKIYLWAQDGAENTSTSTFYFHVRRRLFQNEKMTITDRFLERILPYFSFYETDPELTNIERYVKINNDLRVEDDERFALISKETSPQRLWEGPWIRLKNAATMAKFGNQRSYYYKGEKIDEQVHLGIDLASLPNSPVQAANNGRVLFAERNGIYGLTVIIDHGQGLSSLYGHLSNISVTPDQHVKKGEIIGSTGQTGLAGGDHLHFAVMVNGVFVDPIEWWDSHWIKDNITKKLELLDQQ
ncbi:MAG: M23 family metallopeptidase [Deltaproteobacteria bacterium]|nr:M23 family metallopeptidase [Deltaproteobacteria bacterium]